MAVFDTMRHIRPNVSTVCIGLAASMGAFLLASGQQVGLAASTTIVEQVVKGHSGGPVTPFRHWVPLYCFNSGVIMLLLLTAYSTAQQVLATQYRCPCRHISGSGFISEWDTAGQEIAYAAQKADLSKREQAAPDLGQPVCRNKHLFAASAYGGNCGSRLVCVAPASCHCPPDA